MTGLLESVARKLSFVWTHDRSVRSFSRERRSPARLAIQRHGQVRSCCQGTPEYALLLVRFGLWRGTVQELADSVVERRWIDAGSNGLAGKRIEFPGLQFTITDVLVRVELLDGRKL